MPTNDAFPLDWLVILAPLLCGLAWDALKARRAERAAEIARKKSRASY